MQRNREVRTYRLSAKIYIGTSQTKPPRFLMAAITARLRPSIRMAFQVLQRRDVKVANFGTIANEQNQPEPSMLDQQPRSVAVRAAYELLGDGHTYLDVRTCEEFIAGHPTGAVNIPYLLKKGSDMSKNLKFLDEVSSKFEKQDEIAVGCQSGRRSLMAAADMQSAGFRSVVDVAGGYNSWVENGLPTTTN
ncbi:Thiosulfate sulfurtransferase 16, chloroplastic [Linum perenne]